MIRSVVFVLAFAVIGDSVAIGAGLPVPGAALGMLALAAWLTARGETDAGLARLFDHASPHFTLFFVPAAVGVVGNADLLASAWFHVLAAVVVGTTATIAVTGLLGQHLLQTVQKRTLPL